jgi:tetratricopeptide (TPR) repeat protein
VRLFLRGQNLEQVRLVDEAIEHYEQAVAGGFDAIGPYDRLIAIYTGRNAHKEIVRVAEAALLWARTYDDKRAWYEDIRRRAEEALRSLPDARGPEF